MNLRHVNEIRKFFASIKTPIKLRDLCFMLPDNWFFVEIDFGSLATFNSIYWISVFCDVLELSIADS